MKRNGFAQIPVMIGLLIMAVAVPVATKLVQQNQDTRNQAAGCGSSGTISQCGSKGGCATGYRCLPNGCSYDPACGGFVPTSTPRPTTAPSVCNVKYENLGCNYAGNGINCANQMGQKVTSANCSVSFKCVASSSCVPAPTTAPTATPIALKNNCNSGDSCVMGWAGDCSGGYTYGFSGVCQYSVLGRGQDGICCTKTAPTPAYGDTCEGTKGGTCWDLDARKMGECTEWVPGNYIDCLENTGSYYSCCKKIGSGPTPNTRPPVTATPIALKNNCNSGDSCVMGWAGDCSGGYTYGFSGVCQYSVLGRGQDGICCTKTAPTPAYGDTCEGTKGGTCWDLDARKMGECTQWVPGNYVDCFASGGGYYGCCKKVGTNPAPTETASQCSPLTDSVTCANTPGCYWHSDTKKCSNVKPTIPTATPTPNTRPPITATPTATGPLKCYCEGNCADKICNWQSAPGNGYTGYCSNTSCQNIPTPRLPSPTSAVGGSSCYCINACYTGATCAYTGYMPAPYVKCPTNSFCNSTNPTATPTTGGGGGTNPSPTGSGAGSGCDGAIPRDICDTNRLSINAQCVNNGWDYDVQLCDQAGRKETCGGRPYCCPSAGGQWTTDMTACGGSGGACTQCAGHPDWKVKGDADCSGTTTINDFSVWKSEYISGNFGTDTKNSWNADFNCDGKVTLNDGSIWTANFIKGLTN